jgi:hypothetical protein
MAADKTDTNTPRISQIRNLRVIRFESAAYSD